MANCGNTGGTAERSSRPRPRTRAPTRKFFRLQPHSSRRTLSKIVLHTMAMSVGPNLLRWATSTLCTGKTTTAATTARAARRETTTAATTTHCATAGVLYSVRYATMQGWLVEEAPARYLQNIARDMTVSVKQDHIAYPLPNRNPQCVQITSESSK